MKGISALSVPRELQRQILPAYLLVGPDEYLRKHVLDAFAGILDPGLSQFNLARFSETDLRGCLDAARTLPMMSARRLVILEDCSRLGDAAWMELCDYLRNPNDRTVLLLVAAKLPEGRSREMRGLAAVISVDAPGQPEARSAIERSFRKDGYEVEAGVVEELLDYVGADMGGLAHEVEKLKLYTLQDKFVHVHDVAALTNRVRSHQVWDLTNQIASRNRKQLLLLLQRLLDSGVVPLVMLKMLYTHFAGLLAVKELEEKSEQEVAKLTGENPYRVRRLMEQAVKFKLGELKSALLELHRADTALKGGSGLPEGMLLESLLVKIVAGP